MYPYESLQPKKIYCDHCPIILVLVNGFSDDLWSNHSWSNQRVASGLNKCVALTKNLKRYIFPTYASYIVIGSHLQPHVTEMFIQLAVTKVLMRIISSDLCSRNALDVYSHKQPETSHFEYFKPGTLVQNAINRGLLAHFFSILLPVRRGTPTISLGPITGASAPLLTSSSIISFPLMPL